MYVLSRTGLFVKNIPMEIENSDWSKHFQYFHQRLTNEMLLEEYESVQQRYKDVQMPIVVSSCRFVPLVIDDGSNEIIFADFQARGSVIDIGISEICFQRTNCWRSGVDRQIRVRYIWNDQVQVYQKLFGGHVQKLNLLFELGQFSVYDNFPALCLAVAELPTVDSLWRIPVANERYASI